MRENNKGGCLLGMEQGMTGMVMKALSLSCDYGLGYKITWICKNSRDGTLTIGTCCMQILLQKRGVKNSFKKYFKEILFYIHQIGESGGKPVGPLTPLSPLVVSVGSTMKQFVSINNLCPYKHSSSTLRRKSSCKHTQRNSYDSVPENQKEVG